MSEGFDDEGRVAARPEPDYVSLHEPVVPGWRLRPLTETKPFALTTEFVGVVVALAALAITAATSDALDGSLAWMLATGLVAAYVFSRGFAKAAAPSRSWDPREAVRGGGDVESAPHARREEVTQRMSTMHRDEYETQVPGAMYGPGMWAYGRGLRQAFPIETKPFFLTSEFWGSVLLLVALAIGAATSDTVDARLFWILATALTIGYVISRGIAKSGTKSRSWDPRDELTHRMRERVTSGDKQ